MSRACFLFFFVVKNDVIWWWLPTAVGKLDQFKMKTIQLLGVICKWQGGSLSPPSQFYHLCVIVRQPKKLAEINITPFFNIIDEYSNTLWASVGCLYCPACTLKWLNWHAQASHFITLFNARNITLNCHMVWCSFSINLRKRKHTFRTFLTKFNTPIELLEKGWAQIGKKGIITRTIHVWVPQEASSFTIVVQLHAKIADDLLTSCTE